MPKRKLKIIKKSSSILMNLTIKTSLIAFLIVIFCIITGLFFSATKITTTMFLTINFIPLMQAIFSINFIYFIIFGSITIALMLYCGKELNKPQNYLITGGAFLTGSIIALILFNLTEYFLVIILSIAGIPLAINYLSKKEEEVKYMKKFRSGASGAGRFLVVFGVAFIIYLALFGYTTRNSLEKNVTNDILAISLGNQETLAEQIQGQIIDLLIQGQQSTIQGIKSIPSYSELEKKNDVDVLTFVTTIEAIESHFESEAYKSELSDQIALNPQNNIGKTIIEQIPLIGFFKKYAWILYTITAFFLISFINEILVKNIAGFFYYLISLIKESTKKQKAEQNQNN